MGASQHPPGPGRELERPRPVQFWCPRHSLHSVEGRIEGSGKTAQAEDSKKEQPEEGGFVRGADQV